MRRYIFLIALIWLITACGNGELQENEPEIPAPPVIIAEHHQEEYIPQEEPDEPIPEPVDIPIVNEYFITMEFEPETRTIRGIETVRYTNRTDTTLSELVFRIPLNAWAPNAIVPVVNMEPITPYPIEFHNRIFRHGHDYGFMDILHISHDNEGLDFVLWDTILTITLPRPLEPDETTQLSIQFQASIPKIAHRTGANDHAVWAGAFLPQEAVFGPNGWHTEPFYPMGSPFILDVANYTVEITTPIGYVVAGTGTKTETYLDDYLITTFTAQMTRDFAFAISPYFRRSAQVTPSGLVEIVLYYYTPTLPVDHILNVAVEVIVFFEETIGTYPYPQLSIVETDMFRNAEKFSSIIFMDSGHMRTSQHLSSLRHEIGHQWFSVIVGSNPIEEAWLNGGLTHFLQSGLLNYPQDLRTVIEREHSDLMQQMPSIRNENNRRLTTRISSYETWADYFRIQHRKAKIMFYALYREMGEGNFRYLLREYYRRFAFQIATGEDFRALAEEIHGSSLDWFFDYWLYTTELPNLP